MARTPRIAALTMVRNEAALLPVWCRHYLRQVGAGNLFVLDHASTDGGTAGLSAEIVPVPDGPLDEQQRAAQVRVTVEVLLQRYDWVVHSDVDELVLADPRHFADLGAYAAAESGVAARAIGFDLHHVPEEEASLVADAPIGGQRRWVRFAASMCKPALVREAVQWSPGFHTSEPAGRFGALYLVHLRYVDLGMGLARLARTRARAALPGTNPHQRVPDAEFEALVRNVAGLQRLAAVPFDPALEPLAPWVQQVMDGAEVSLAGDVLWELPGRFRAVLG